MDDKSERSESAAEKPLVGAAAQGASRLLNREIHEITDPLLRMAQNATPEERISASIQHVLAESGPRQAEVLRRCAIPRWFDAGVLAVLRERDDGNDALLQVLDSYSFVRRINHTRYAYHDIVRTSLLKEWRSQRPDQLRQLNLRLAEYFQARAAEQESQPYISVGSVASKALRVTVIGNRELYLRESIYHLLQADPQAGLQQLYTEFNQADAAHRLGDAEALLQLTADVPLDNDQQLWVRYMQARVNSAALRLDVAAADLRALSDIVQEPLLAARVHQTLGEVYAETGRWTQATELYRASLTYFQAHQLREEAALVMLRLGEAYQEIARNSGGWHVYAYPQSLFWRRLGECWNWLLSVPFALIVHLLGNKRYQLPRSRYLASYQNWLLTWLYRASQRWFERSRTAYAMLGDEDGVINAEQRLAEILARYGHHQKALAQLDALKARVPVDDRYSHAWLDRDRAFSLIALHEVAQAQPLIDAALATFRDMGDVRREASVLALQSYANVEAGNEDAALAGYRDSLERFRKLDYVAAREQVLYDLRAWQRRIGRNTPRAEQIEQIIEAEPEKRYVARFPRSQRPLLQLLVLAWLPMAFLLLAVFVPSTTLVNINRLSLQMTYYNPWAVLTVLLAVAFMCSVVYTAIAFGVIYILPLDVLKREQPDVIITDPDGVTRYNAHGDPITRVTWPYLRQWITADFRLWHLPLPLFSRTMLEQADRTTLTIDGITGWYTNLQCDVKHHLAQLRPEPPHIDADIGVLRSKMGASFVLGVLLLPLFISIENGWAGWLVALVPPALYAALSLLVFGGLLIFVPLAYWLATRPLLLRRSLDIRDIWPIVVAVVGLISIFLGVPESNRVVEQVPALGVGLLLWGAYLFADGAATYFVPREPITRLVLIGVALAAVAVLAIPQSVSTYLDKHNQAIQRRLEVLPGASILSLPLIVGETSADATNQAFAASRLLSQPYSQPRERAESYSDEGNTQFALGNYEQAVVAYDQALALYKEAGDIDSDRTLRQEAASAIYNRGRALQQLGQQSQWQQARTDACDLYAGVAPTECAAPNVTQ